MNLSNHTKLESSRFPHSLSFRTVRQGRPAPLDGGALSRADLRRIVADMVD